MSGQHEGPAADVLDEYPVVLLDMNRTFMFGEDRFGPGEDYAATYRTLGGALPSARVNALVTACHARLGALYPDPAYHDRFPTVADAVRSLPGAEDLGDDDLVRLDRTFALHELGRVPAAHAAALRRLASSHRLALVADVWAQPEPWVRELARAGVLDAFEARVFSSEIGSVKPSPRPFRAAMASLGVGPGDCVMVGDSARRDVGGAAAAGIASVWVGRGEAPAGALAAVGDLVDLVPPA